MSMLRFEYVLRKPLQKCTWQQLLTRIALKQFENRHDNDRRPRFAAAVGYLSGYGYATTGRIGDLHLIRVTPEGTRYAWHRLILPAEREGAEKIAAQWRAVHDQRLAELRNFTD